MSGYEVGTVAHITVRDIAGVSDFRASKDGKGWASLDPSIGWVPDSDVTDVRPLVVLDIPRPDGFLVALDHAIDVAPDAHMAPLLSLREQITEQTAPPKPDEPTGLGAVVEDRRGHLWQRVDLANNEQRWFAPATGNWHAWCHVSAVEILSHGVDQ